MVERLTLEERARFFNLAEGYLIKPAALAPIRVAAAPTYVGT
jgi:hypothetical protein